MSQPKPRPGIFASESGAIWVLWLTYGSFYFARANISAAIPGLESEYNFTKEQIGWILGSTKIAYAIGQLVNGQLAEKFSPRKMLAVGMFASAAMNVLFGLGGSLWFLIFVWACNGYSQALGWTPCMRVGANWFPAHKRGKIFGIIGTGYQASAALTYVIASGWAQVHGWRWAHYIGAVILASSAIHMLLFMRESPDSDSPDAQAGSASAKQETDWAQVRANIVLTLANKNLWILGAALGLLNACRYGYMDWGLTHILEQQGGSLSKAGLKYAILPIGGIAGALLSGWATDRFFGGRRIPVIVGLLVSLGLLTIAYNQLVQTGPVAAMFVLMFAGFAIFGPQVLLVGTTPIDFAKKGTAAAAVGLVNFMGYVGAFMGDVLTGRLVDQYGWEVAVNFWAGYAFASAGLAALLWKVKPSD
ncbi:MAG: OPA family glycerol-3-phosphate transporter-like MFS transporter [Candidatus Binatia bacterium]|jgi:OPA family glycerol-3-phosphate transporter-like MFS transporter